MMEVIALFAKVTRRRLQSMQALYEPGVPPSSRFYSAAAERRPFLSHHMAYHVISKSINTWVWVKPGCGDIMDAAIIYQFYSLTPGPHVSPHS
jgi:hypothetical protein